MDRVYPLQRHQIDIMTQMRRRESDPSLSMHHTASAAQWTFQVPLGVLADPSGTGLSWTIVSYVAGVLADQFAIQHAGISPDARPVSHPWCPVTVAPVAYPQHHTLIVSPPRALGQYQRLFKSRDIEAGLYQPDQPFPTTHVVLCPVILLETCLKGAPRQWQRLIIDDMEHVRYPLCSTFHDPPWVASFVNARFLWLVSPADTRKPRLASSFPRNVFALLPPDIVAQLTIETDRAVLEASMGLPPMTLTVFHCSSLYSGSTTPSLSPRIALPGVFAGTALHWLQQWSVTEADPQRTLLFMSDELCDMFTSWHTRRFPGAVPFTGVRSVPMGPAFLIVKWSEVGYVQSKACAAPLHAYTTVIAVGPEEDVNTVRHICQRINRVDALNLIWIRA